MRGFECDYGAFSANGAGNVGVDEDTTIIAGQMPTLLNVGCLVWSQPMKRSVNPLDGELPTGEPYAGDPPVRFGGGRIWEINQIFLPL